MDSNRFDNMSRQIGEQSDRRQMLKTAAGGTLALLGMGALSRVALGQDVEAEAGYDGQKCKRDADCKKGLTCKINTGSERGRCRYKHGCGGKKKDACKKDKDCCGGFECKNKKCRRK
ncbi:MAG: hypothetical protein KC442_13910 [Thermomicrobiales bacterium]|nr:hypothetical protein [Thermomicrobiales bacterium]